MPFKSIPIYLLHLRGIRLTMLCVTTFVHDELRYQVMHGLCRQLLIYKSPSIAGALRGLLLSMELLTTDRTVHMALQLLDANPAKRPILAAQNVLLFELKEGLTLRATKHPSGDTGLEVDPKYPPAQLLRAWCTSPFRALELGIYCAWAVRRVLTAPSVLSIGHKNDLLHLTKGLQNLSTPSKAVSILGCKVFFET